jgi:hypothetical protein
MVIIVGWPCQAIIIFHNIFVHRKLVAGQTIFLICLDTLVGLDILTFFMGISAVLTLNVMWRPPDLFRNQTLFAMNDQALPPVDAQQVSGGL